MTKSTEYEAYIRSLGGQENAAFVPIPCEMGVLVSDMVGVSNPDALLTPGERHPVMHTSMEFTCLYNWRLNGNTSNNLEEELTDAEYDTACGYMQPGQCWKYGSEIHPDNEAAGPETPL